MPRPDADLHQTLKGVSRSFYLSMQVLPAAVHDPIAIGYLLARAADTIADTEAVPARERLRLLHQLRAAVQAQDGDSAAALQRAISAVLLDGASRAAPASGAEQALLRRVADCLALLHGLGEPDLGLSQRVLGQLIEGMDRDLRRFPAVSDGQLVPPERVVALETQAELDQYTYYAAGCVGEFWTEITAAHLPRAAHLRAPELLARAVKLGKGLQLVNVLRDAPADLRAGRCYWPREWLAPEGLSPAGLAAWAGGQRAPTAAERQALQRVTGQLQRLTEDTLAEAWAYVQAIPAREVRLRLAATWPLLLGLSTLEAIGAGGSPLLRPQAPVKVRRAAVYRMLAASTGAAWLDALHATRSSLDFVEMDRALRARQAGAYPPP